MQQRSLRGGARCWLEGRAQASLPTPSPPASFPHMVLIRSGLRDSSQRKWLCTESFCEGRRGEGERGKRKKERKEGNAEVGGGQDTPTDSLTLQGCKVSTATPPVGFGTQPFRNEGPSGSLRPSLTLPSDLLEELEVLGSPVLRVPPPVQDVRGPWPHLRASPGQRTEPSGVHWLSPHGTKETGEAGS